MVIKDFSPTYYTIMQLYKRSGALRAVCEWERCTRVCLPRTLNRISFLKTAPHNRTVKPLKPASICCRVLVTEDIFTFVEPAWLSLLINSWKPLQTCVNHTTDALCICWPQRASVTTLCHTNIWRVWRRLFLGHGWKKQLTNSVPPLPPFHKHTQTVPIPNFVNTLITQITFETDFVLLFFILPVVPGKQRYFHREKQLFWIPLSVSHIEFEWAQIQSYKCDDNFNITSIYIYRKLSCYIIRR